VRFGNLLTLPVGGGLLYVEPLYVQGEGQGSQPLLRKVLVSFGDQVAYENTLPEALNKLFGAGAGDTVPPPTGGTTGSPSPSATPSPGSSAPPATGGGTGELASSVSAINAAIAHLSTAQKNGDFVGIGQAQAELAAAIQRFQRAQSSSPAAPSAAPLPSASPGTG
jgi:uncharacterized membrane protein (UPF0182 family)